MNTFSENFPTDTLYEIDYAGDTSSAGADAIVRQADVVSEAAVRELVSRLLTHQDPVVLDLTAAKGKHVPDAVRPARVVGVGTSGPDPGRHPAADEYLVHDLNDAPALPFGSATFDAVLCASYIDLWNDSVAVFTEAGRVLKPGGLFVVIFSNCYVRLWRQSLGEGRLKRVRNAFYESKSFERPRVLMLGPDSESGERKDSVFAVYAEKPSADEGSDSRPERGNRHPYSEREIAKRRLQVKDTLRCPYCDDELKQYWVTQTPFTEWPSEYQYVCLNDECSYYVGGWQTLARQEVPGSYRFMFEPTVGGCYSIPVLSRHDLKNRTTD